MRKIKDTGHKHDESKRICVGMIFMPRNNMRIKKNLKQLLKIFYRKRFLYLRLETSSS